MKIYILGCQPDKVEQLAEQAGLLAYDLEVLNQVPQHEVDSKRAQIIKDIDAGEVAGIINATFAPWNLLGADILHYCRGDAHIPVSETFIGNVNWEKAFQKLAEQLSRKE